MTRTLNVTPDQIILETGFRLAIDASVNCEQGDLCSVRMTIPAADTRSEYTLLYFTADTQTLILAQETPLTSEEHENIIEYLSGELLKAGLHAAKAVDDYSKTRNGTTITGANF